MATKKGKISFDGIELEGEILTAVNYATYYCRLPLFTSLLVLNNGVSDLENLKIEINASSELITPVSLSVELIPHESSVRVNADNILNPRYLAELEGVEQSEIRVDAFVGKELVASFKSTVTALPMDAWSGISGNCETLSAFVRPRLADCKKIVADADERMKTWGYSGDWGGYVQNDKNVIRNALAAIFSAVRKLGIEKENVETSNEYVKVRYASEILAQKRAATVELAVMVASCLENARFNPVILLGKERVGVGLWLYESCFTSACQDDMSVVEKYTSDGVNNLALFDVDDVFARKNAGFTTSELHVADGLRKGVFEVLVDVKRCRVGGIMPTPIKVKTCDGYEILSDRQASYDEKPNAIASVDKNAYKSALTKENTWQRRLLDLSLKNNLLNFKYGRDAIHLLTGNVFTFCEKITNVGVYTLKSWNGYNEDKKYFDNDERKDGELVALQLNSGIFNAYGQTKTLVENASSLMRKAKSSQEEVGANTLYLAVGFLAWKNKDEKDEKYAPLILYPATIKKTKSDGIKIEIDEEYQINTTLVEFLYQSFGIDIRGLENTHFDPQQIFSVLRGEIVNMKGWRICNDAYIAQFTFTRYAMWSDVKNNISVYKKNPLVASLLANENKLVNNKLCGVDEDDASPFDIVTPLACDSSQYSAVAESAKGTTFVLHGPPGTGKSQTITNIIANAVSAGKRVLFVAEKQAALQVVKKRLNDVGVGEFCLELHSGKSVDKSEIIASIENTLSLKSEFDKEKYEAVGDRIIELKNTLKMPVSALHKKRRLGVSVYEGILYYLQNKSAPELLNIESTFYDSLTKRKLEEYENMLLTAQAAAKECGGVYRSPFDNVNITEYDKRVQSVVLRSAEVLLLELKHLKNYTQLLLDTFNQKLSTYTLKKLENLRWIATVLSSNSLDKFFACAEDDFNKFYNANVRYDAGMKYWMTRFNDYPDLSQFADKMESELENWGENYRSSKIIINVIKRINRCTKKPIDECEEAEWLKRACDIEASKSRLLSYTNLSKNFVGFGGKINETKRKEFLRPIYELHERCAQTFMDYNADSFNSVCINSYGGLLAPLLDGFIAVADSFTNGCGRFNNIVQAKTELVNDEDVIEYYTAKCTALIDNIDMLSAWCMYKNTAKKLNDSGLTFITDAMESGTISGEKILSAFRKNIYRNFIQTNIPADDTLSHFSANVLDESALSYAMAIEEFSKLSIQKLRYDLVSRLPSSDTEGVLATELLLFQRQVKGNLRGLNLRKLFAETTELLKVVSPCMLMSPSTVSQYLPAKSDLFDMVIFDEASQLPTCEAVPSLARGKSAVIVGDPKQLPPTSFFMNVGQDEDNVEAEDLESVLEDCLALGMPEKHLNWHYRSKHESLIAFSNVTYYSSRLCTFPSPDAMDSRVSLRYVQNGVYERGERKVNKEEAELLIDEVIKRLKDEKLSRSSIGIVTFSTPQQSYIEKLLYKKIADAGLEEVAFEREEPLFVKNLENVQGDERDVILFSVCYGPDKNGKISLNFGPLNQIGGWRRLNVAVSRAREEMIIFSSMRHYMIDLSRTTSKGVAGLKSFLEFAEKGRTKLAVRNDEIIVNRAGIGKYVASELSAYGYECRTDVGVSDFKIDVGVIDPKNKHKFILAILCDGTRNFSVKDRTVMQVQTLKRNDWNVIRLYSINFFNNPKREIKKIKEYLDKLTCANVRVVNNMEKPYKIAKIEGKVVDPSYILCGENDAEVKKAIKAIVSAEEPISFPFLVKRTMACFGINKYGVKIENKIESLLCDCDIYSARVLGVNYYAKTDKRFSYDRYRVDKDVRLRSQETDYTPFDIVACVKFILLSKVSVYADELVPMVIKTLGVPRSSDKMTKFVNACIDRGVGEGLFVRSVADKISLA